MSGRRYKKGVWRGQADLFPARLEDYVAENNAVRAIDAYVESTDLVLEGFEHARDWLGSGQPAYDPKGLLKVYLYGYLNRVRSSRQLERECRRNVEVMWLVEGLTPTYRTIAGFRQHNAEGLRRIHADFVMMCRELGLFGGQCVAIDGSHFKGNVSSKSFDTQKGLKKELERVERWLSELEARDEVEEGIDDELSEQELSDKLERLRKRQARSQQRLAELQEAGCTQQSRTDGDARLLNKRGQKVQGYNVQVAVDEKHHLIVADEVTSEPNDLGQLAPMAKQAKAVLGVEQLSVLADAGYYSGAHLHECSQAGITAYVAEPSAPKGRRDDKRFTREAFVYDTATDRYRCPAGKWLRRSGQARWSHGQNKQRYASRQRECARCAERVRCLSAKGQQREIWRSEHEELLELHRQRMAAHPEMMAKRRDLAEHPFGTLKHRAGWSHFLVRGLRKVRGEWSLMALGYNFTRVLNVIGTKVFIEYCQARSPRALAA